VISLVGCCYPNAVNSNALKWRHSRVLLANCRHFSRNGEIGSANMSVSASQTEEQVSTRKPTTLCEECKSNPSKYTCPGCSLHSCSLPCVKSHKERTGCSGKRNQTQFLPLSKFDDSVLLSGTLLLKPRILSLHEQKKRPFYIT